MRNLILACAAIAVVSGVMSVNLWRELREARLQSADLRGRLLQAEERAATARRTDDSLMTMALAPTPTSIAAPLQQQSAPSPQPAKTQPAQNNNEAARILLNQNELMKDPEYRKARLAQTRLGMPQNYPGLIEELGLNPEEADRLYDLLAEQQLEMSDATRLTPLALGEQPDPAAMQETIRRRQELQAMHDEALMTMLGSGRYSQWQDYQPTRSARQQVLQLGRTLDAIGVPLSAAQTKPLTAAYVAEQARQREEQQRMIGSLRQSGGVPDQGRLMEERFRQQAESNRRLVDAARPHLNAQQLETLQASLEQQLVMNRASQRASQRQIEMQGAQGAAQDQMPTTIIYSTIETR